MPISDLSSDVCSSDLHLLGVDLRIGRGYPPTSALPRQRDRRAVAMDTCAPMHGSIGNAQGIVERMQMQRGGLEPRLVIACAAHPLLHLRGIEPLPRIGRAQWRAKVCRNVYIPVE